jgi:hypothetical protein
MIIKIITMVSIWYVGWFLLCIIAGMGKVTLPSAKIAWFDLLGNNVFIFVPSVMFLIWRYLI